MRFVFNNFILDSKQRVLWKEGEAVPLSPKVFETLELLVLSEGRIVSKQEFMRALWPDSFVEDGNLTQNIFILRKLLGTSDDGRSYIETFSRRGYRFAGTVRREEVAVEGEAPAPAKADFGGGDSDSIGGPALVDNSLLLVETQISSPPAAKRRVTKPLVLIFSTCLILLLVAGSGLAFRWKTRMRVGAYRRITNDGRAKDLLNTPSLLVSDGNLLYFTEEIGDRSILAQVAAEGGEISYGVAPSPKVHVVALQPGDRRTLLFGANWPIDPDQPLLGQDISSGTSSPVFNLRAQDASWSPDGRKLAYTQLGNVFVRSSDGKTIQVAAVRGLAYWLRWSQDGRLLRFSESYQGFHDRLWEVASAGGGLHQLFADQSDSDHMCCGSWTKSGRAFVYLSVQTSNSKIHIRTEDDGMGSRWTQQSLDLSAAPLDRWIAPLPGPDGKHLFAIGEELHGRLVRIDPTTRRPEPFIGGISAEGVSFSPDHGSIVWTAYPEGTLWRSRSDGSGRVQLTQAPLVARFPHWSPDGSTIVFTAASPGSDWQLYTVPSDGGEVKVLVSESRGQGVASWSPDGKALAFGHILDPAEARKQPLDIEIFHVKDRSATPIPGSKGLSTARWSPDGRYLTAVTEDNHTLRLYDMQKGLWSDLARSNINDVVWSPDSKSLFFDTNVGSDPTLYRVRLSDRKLEPWANLRDFRRAGFFAPWLGMAPDGSPILLEDVSIQELYSIALNLP
jgi:DNA-binding winged helix-turn-helix (wHTH) protein/Tol biopolymer transport system component